MTTKAKLWLGFGLLIGLLVLSSGLTFLRVQSTRTEVVEMANTARPRMAAVGHLETSVRGYVLAVRTRIQGLDGGGDQVLNRERGEVNRYLREYESLAASDLERDLAAKFAERWTRILAVGDRLVAGNLGPDEAAVLWNEFYTRRLDLERFVNDELQADATAAYNQSRDEALGNVDDVNRFTIVLLIFGTITAVTASVLIGRAIVNTEARKTAILDAALDCIISIDKTGKVTEFNPAAEETFGYQRADALGRELADLIIPPNLRDAHRKGLAHYLKTGEGPVLNRRVEVPGVRSDGSELPLELSITRIRVKGPAQFTAYLRDITERKEAENAMQRANEFLEERVAERTAELEDANVALSRSNQELDQFASVASHDLQEPLRKIQAFGDRLNKKFAAQLGEQGRLYVERMGYSATRMRTLIDSLLTFSRVTTKAEPFVPTELEEIANEVVEDLEGRLQEVDGRVEIGKLPKINADPLQMRQLFQNLIANGLKFRRSEEPPVVKVDAKIDGGELCEISFADNGIGFEEVYLDRIFDVFQRLHGRQEYDGTGMGLAIVRKIVERHGGTITATSELEKGSTFLVTLPVRQDETARLPRKELME